MAYTKIMNGATGDAEVVNNNFAHIGSGHKLPMGGSGLGNTTGIYDLGSSVYRWNNLFCVTVPTATVVSNVWRRIASYEINSVNTSTTIITFSGFSGEVDQEYCMFFRFKMDTTSANATFVFGSDSTTSYGYNRFASNISVAAGDVGTAVNLPITRSDASSLHCGWTMIYARQNYDKIIIHRHATMRNVSRMLAEQLSGIWSNTTINISGWSLYSPYKFLTGTFVEIYARR